VLTGFLGFFLPVYAAAEVFQTVRRNDPDYWARRFASSPSAWREESD